MLIALIHSGQTENETFTHSGDNPADTGKKDDGNSANNLGESGEFVYLYPFAEHYFRSVLQIQSYCECRLM